MSAPVGSSFIFMIHPFNISASPLRPNSFSGISIFMHSTRAVDTFSQYVAKERIPLSIWISSCIFFVLISSLRSAHSNPSPATQVRLSIASQRCSSASYSTQLMIREDWVSRRGVATCVALKP